MNVLHRDLKLANILVNFKNIKKDTVFNNKLDFREKKKTCSLIGNVDVFIGDLGFAKEMKEDLT